MKGLVSKKHDYLGKLNHNRKSVISLKRYIDTINQLLFDTVKMNKSSPNFLPSEVKAIEESIKSISTELDGTEDEVLSMSIERLAKSPTTRQNPRASNSIPRTKKDKLTIDEIIKTKKEDSSDRNTVQGVQSVILPNIGSTKFANEKLKQNKKYDYIILRNKSTTTKSKQASSNYNPQWKNRAHAQNPNKSSSNHNQSIGASRSASRENEKKPETLVINDWDPILEDFDTYLDYDQTSEFEYKKVLKKTEHLMILKEKCEKGLKEKEKIYEKKFKDIENTIKENQKKLNLFKQVLNTYY